jgi:hypothetical protein
MRLRDAVQMQVGARNWTAVAQVGPPWCKDDPHPKHTSSCSLARLLLKSTASTACLAPTPLPLWITYLLFSLTTHMMIRILFTHLYPRSPTPQSLGGGLSEAQCQHRWSKVVKPGLIKGGWTREEDLLVKRMVEEAGVVEVCDWLAP